MIRINLLPVREARRRADLQQQAILFAIVMAISLGVMGTLRYSLSRDIAKSRTRVSKINEQIQRFKPQLEKVETYKEKKAAVEKKLQVIHELDASRSGPVRVLEEIASRTPDRLWITKLDAKGKNLQLHGMSLDNEIVAEFLTKLNDSKYFRDVELKVTDLQKKGGLKVHRFQLSAVITSPELEAKKKADAAKKAKAPKKKKSAKKKRGAKKASVLSPLIADVR